MTITTKYDVGDEVWVMHNNHVRNLEIDMVEFTKHGVGDTAIRLIYTIVAGISLNGDQIREEFFEHQLFPTKEELLKSL